MGENLRVTVVATGLGHAASSTRPQLVSNRAEGIRTGTDDIPMMVGRDFSNSNSDVPAVIRKPRGGNASAQVRALETPGMDTFDIPAFLRTQADLNRPFFGCGGRPEGRP